VKAGMRRNRFRRAGEGRAARGTVGAAAATGRIMGPLCDGAPVPRVSFKAAARDAAGFPGVIPARHPPARETSLASGAWGKAWRRRSV